MAESIEKLEQLIALDDGIHWFCPRTSLDDGTVFYDEDLGDAALQASDEEKMTRAARIRDATLRRDNALEACEILAYDGEDAIPYQDQLKNGFRTQLTRCDICVREFHRAHILLKASLDARYPSEDVAAFMEKFDEMNNARIVTGLKSMTATLKELPPQERTISAAGDGGMYAMFEALNSTPFLNDEALLQQSFDEPFRLVQTRKPIKLPNYAPGMAAFLFSAADSRAAWARRNFALIKRPLFADEFEFSVKPFLEAAMRRVNIACLDLGFLPTFWHALSLVLPKVTKELVTNHLRAMDTNLFTLSLEHFQVDAAHFHDLVACYQTLLGLSASDFWDAMGTVPPQTVIDTICRSPSLERSLTAVLGNETLEVDMMWADAVIKHIKPANVVPPLRTLLDQLLSRFQATKYSRHGRNVAWKMGLACLSEALSAVFERVDGGPVYTHLIEAILASHLPAILEELEGIEHKTEMTIDDTEILGLEIVKFVFALDVKSLQRDRRVIVSTRGPDHQLGVSTLDTWKLTLRYVKGGYPALSSAVLSGTRDLLSLEKIPPAQVTLCSKPAQAWNVALEKVLTHTNTDLLERLDGFSPDHLAELYQERSAARGIFALLFSGEEQIHQSALSIVKNLSGEDNRRTSLMHLVKVFAETTLSAAAESMNVISKARVFTPCSIMMKLCADIYDCLCNSQDGVLRAKSFAKDSDVQALSNFWRTTWSALEMVFETTEKWSSCGYEKSRMHDFCRETMDFADNVFDQYSIIANTLKDAAGNRDTLEIGRELLQVPNKTFRSITKWLRLRDEYLIDKSVRLTTKILYRLQQVGVVTSDEAVQFVQDVVTSGGKNTKIKTKLTMNQKAELQRALEQHTGKQLSDVVDLEMAPKKKQSSLQDWAKSGSESGSSTPVAQSRPSRGVIDLDAWTAASKRTFDTDNHREAFVKSASTASEEYKKRMAQKRAAELQAKARAVQQKQESSYDFIAKRKQAKAEQERAKREALAKEGGGGSGLHGIGDLGKVHSVKGQNVMVSSDDESEEDDEADELDAELFGSSKTTMKRRREPPVLVPEGASGPKPEQKKGPTRIQRTARSLKDMRARLAPDLAPLHRIILSWDFLHEGDYPPGANPDSFSEVSKAFQDPVTYQNTFEQLLTLEAWQGIVKSREENSSKPYEIKVMNRSNVDSFLEISSIVGHAENRELQLQEGDIVLFSRDSKPQSPSSSHCLARIYRVKRQKAHLEIVYQTMPGSPLAPHLTMQAIIYGLKVQSIIPLEREYGALKALQYYDLCNQIIRAKPSTRIAFSDRQISSVRDIYNVNNAQAEAINAALENDGFSLIQGPPGSGKTKTIVAIVGGLLTQVLSNPSKGASKIAIPKTQSNQNNGGEAPSKKLLVCAPSNAAVDELVMRLKAGVKTRSGVSHAINVVRIGRSDAINSQVVDVTMDELVARKLGSGSTDNKTREQNAELFKEHERISAQLRDLYMQRDSGAVKGTELGALESTLTNVRRRKNELGVRIDNAKDQERNAGREAELNRKRAQQAVLDEAHVICATLSGSGHDMFRNLNIEFETVVIDEAAQCVEMSSLIPLKYGCIKCVMVGDPKQLPPTVFSKEAAKFQYEQSLFVRMQNNFAKEVHLLDTQYRMHPAISVFPSRSFYDGLLKDGDGMARLRTQPWHVSALLAPYRFYDVKGQHQSAPKGHSLINLAEIGVAMALFNRLVTDFKGYDFTGKIGIITPYKSQLGALKEHFSNRYGNAILDSVEFNTTDAFQGRESEVIIFSCVRASPAGGIGFLQDIRRMNVGLTRAKSSLWVLGNSESLVRGRYWKKLVDDAQARDCYTTGDIRAMLNRPSSAYPAGNANTQSMQDRSSDITHTERNGSGGIRHPSAAESNADGERMDGIRYRFEDRVTKTQKPPPPGPSHTEDKSLPGNLSEDVEMGDADMTNGSRDPSTDSVSPRTGTPSAVSGESRAVRPNGSGNSRPALAVPTVSQVVRKKRPAPSPFMPPKRPRPAP